MFTVRATANTLGPITDPSMGPSSPASAPVTPTPDGRAGSATGIPGPDTGVWVPRETFPISNTTSSAIDLTGYALWDKDPRITTDTPDHVFPRGTVVPANGTLRVRSGPPTTLEPASATLHYTGRATLFTQAGDRIELANLNKAPVACTSWGGVTCRGQQPVSTSTQPVGVTARTTASSMTVAWGAPISRGGTAITGYTATAFDAPNGGNVVGACSTGGTARACTISGLALGGRYYAEVVATNAVGTSAPSAPRVLGAPRTVPSAPGNVTATGVPGGMSVTWTPAAENGATITRYTASAYTAGTGGSPVASCTTSNGTMTGCAIPNLQQGTPYFIDVTATNRAGTGAPNSPRVVAMPSGAPRAISTYSKGKVTVRWDPPADGSAVITGYSAKLYTKASAGKRVGSCTAAAGKTSCKTKKMKKRTKYYISLSTITTAGTFTVTPRMVTGPAKKASAPKVTGATPQATGS